ncbi:MAG: inward rectifier potassium channel [Crocinitomix sp.]|jgi:inward rectifier potassium channel
MGSEIQDPGIGTQFNRPTKRVINQDGSYNVVKKGGKRGFRDIFKFMIEISWVQFFAILFAGYIGMNLVFTILYFLIGYENIVGIRPDGPPAFVQTFFFSIQTFTTVGYGTLAPRGIPTQSVATVEAFIGFLSFSLATGLAYGRFSRPNSKIIFSDHVLYSNYLEGKSIKIKLANERDNVLLEVTAKMILTMDKALPNGKIEKLYFQLPLEIDRIELLPFTWTLVHKIDSESPFWGKNKAEIHEANPEFLILIKGFDETFSQHVHTKRSFITTDIKWNQQFAKIFAPNDDGVIEFDIKDLNKIKAEDE